MAYGKNLEGQLIISSGIITGARTRTGRKIFASEVSSETSRISTRRMEAILESLKTGKNQETTKENYYKVWTKFNEFVIRLDNMPKTWENRVNLYCSYLIHDKGLQSSTVKSYVSAIKSVLIDDGYQWSDKTLVLNAIIGTCKLKNDTLKIRRPIRRRILEALICEVQRMFAKKNQPYLEILYTTAFLLAYYGMMRAGEITKSVHTAKAKDIHCSRTKKKILIILYSSKTHTRANRPQEIKIDGYNRMLVKNNGKTITTNIPAPNIEYCPYQWTQKYLANRGNYLTASEELLIFRDGTPLSAQQLRTVLRKALKNIGLNEKLYDLHSFRIGRATDLFKQGVSIDTIKHLGRWKSKTVYKYLRD